MPELTDADRKRLTLYLGECWHDFVDTGSGWNDALRDREFCILGCKKVVWSEREKKESRRSFTTSADLFAVYSKMVERGEWEDFMVFAELEYMKREIYSYKECIAWLFCLSDPSQIGERMEMAGAWLREKEK